MRRRILNLTIKYAGDFTKIKRALEVLEPVKDYGYQGNYITILDAEYPSVFLDLKCPPFTIFYKGDIGLLKTAAISIVGSRNACDYGLYWTKQFTRELAQDYTIVSGLALGIDACAHKEALTSNQKTIAVLGCGIDYIYPYKNRLLFQEIAEKGLIISEFYGAMKPKPYFFPYRNRLIAALGQSLYVMQAGLRSGTLISASEALELNKEIYVLPYAIDDQAGLGCNLLIQEGANILFDKI